MRTHHAFHFLACLALTACGGDDDDGGTGADAGPDAAVSGSWQKLIEGDWSLEAGSEDWYCVSKTLEEDVTIGGFRPIDPLGTHHTLLTYGEPQGPDEEAAPCKPNSNSPQTVYASGINTNDLELPDGVGFVIEAGQQLHLNLHLFNVGDERLVGTSGVEILTMAPEAVVEEAELFLPGAFGFQIPQDENYSYSSNCDIREEQHVFAVLPHMHELGRHLKTELTIGGETTVLWDEDYDFDQQSFTVFEPIALADGDRITTTCSWFFPADPERPEVIGWGNSSKEEMCYSIMMRYPRLPRSDDYPNCTDDR